MIYIGTSGWQYDSWRGDFYPASLKKDEWLPFFADRFPTVEVNNSFYRLPSEDAFARWRARTPDSFLFAVKASRFITHLKRLRDPEPSLELLWSRATRLGDKLGPVLFQLPPRFEADVDRLRAFIRALPSGIVAAFEFRDDTWTRTDVTSMLDDAGAAWVLADRPGWRKPLIVTGGWSYVRFHQGAKDRSDYTRTKLQRWADKIAALEARDVYVYFNNDPGGAAIRDANTLRAMLVDRGVQLAA